MTVTHAIIEIIGYTYATIGLLCLINPERIRKTFSYFAEKEKKASLVYEGIAALIVGLSLIYIFQDHLGDYKSMLVYAFGWIAVTKSFFFIFAASGILKLIEWLKKRNQSIRGIGVFYLLIAAVFII